MDNNSLNLNYFFNTEKQYSSIQLKLRNFQTKRRIHSWQKAPLQKQLEFPAFCTLCV